MPSRKIEDLHPDLQPLAKEFIRLCALKQCDVLIICTYRSNEEQAELYSQGRSKPGKIVTHAPPGSSKHNFTVDGKPAAKAFDVVPLVDGKAEWNTGSPKWKIIGEVARFLRLQWGGDWASFKDYPHVELLS